MKLPFLFQNKKRYEEEGWDLDLTYIPTAKGSKIIAMSYPSSGLTACYRNGKQTVASFLNQKHSSNYKIYNLCAEMESFAIFFTVQNYLVFSNFKLVSFVTGLRD